MPLNPNARSFVPIDSKTDSKISLLQLHDSLNKIKKDQQLHLDQLELLSRRVAETLFEPIQVSQLERKLKNCPQQAFIIPAITNYDGLEQVAQITHSSGIYEVFWDSQKNRILFDGPVHSWQFSNMTIRQLVTYYFGVDIADDSTFDQLASSAPAVLVDIRL